MKIRFLVLSTGVLLLASSCAPSPRYTSSSSKSSTSLQKNSSTQKTTSKKKSNFDTTKKTFTGISSYYGKKFHGKLTANGEIFDMYGLTAAHKEIPLNTIVRVTNLANDKSQILRINDRGPYVGNRILDCSYGAALKLGFVNQGTTEVRIDVIEWGDNVYMHH
jgi:rare lipoprotein A